MEVLNILVVDDEPGIRSGVTRILENFNVSYPFMDEDITFNVIEAETGEEGIEIIDNNQPDIVLLDNKLPGIQGIEVLEYVKEKELDILVVMITSYASLEVAVKATRDGAYDFIPKPFTPQELRSSLENISKHLFLRRMTQKMQVEGKQIRFQFLSVLSHELKAPLNAIEGYLAMVKNREFGDNIDDYEKMIDRSLSRVKGMRGLIMDMLDLTKIESGKKKRSLQEVELKSLAKAAIDTMHPYAIQRDINVYLNAHDKITMFADADEMEIIFNNLISNAIKYNRDGGRVDCTIRAKEDVVTITVADTGIGMTKIDMSKLFNDFVRIKNQKTKNISGSGLGLSIVKKLADLYNGDVNVCSKPDEGSTFTVTLPKK